MKAAFHFIDLRHKIVRALNCYSAEKAHCDIFSIAPCPRRSWWRRLIGRFW